MRRVVPRPLYLLGLLTVLALVVPSGAWADGAVTLVSGELRFTLRQPGRREPRHHAGRRTPLNCNPLPTPCLQLANGPQRIRDQVAGAACQQLIFNGQPFDTIVVCELTVAPRLRLTLNDGDDFAQVGPSVLPTTMDGGTGNDNLSSDSGADTAARRAG